MDGMGSMDVKPKRKRKQSCVVSDTIVEYIADMENLNLLPYLEILDFISCF